MKRWLKKNSLAIPPINKDDIGNVYACGSYIFVVIGEIDVYWDVVDTIIHESVHVYQKGMEYIGEVTKSGEAQAYHIAAIATNLLKDHDAVHEKW